MSEDWSQAQEWTPADGEFEPVMGERVWVEMVDGNSHGGRVVGWTRTELTVQGLRMNHPYRAQIARIRLLDRPRD